MADSTLDALKKRYRFDEWQRAGREGEQLFVRNYRVLGDELPNRLVRSRIARLGAAKRLNTSTWESLAAVDKPLLTATGEKPIPTVESLAAASAAADAGGRPVVVDVFEYPSRVEAQEALLELTGQFHRPVDLDVQTDDVGDVRIATPDGAWFAFARGNLVVRIVSGNGLTTPARTVAQQIDDSLMAKPPVPVVSTSDIASPLVVEEGRPQRFAARISLAESEAASEDQPEEEKPFIKVFSKGGTVELEPDLSIVAETPEVEVEVFEEESEGQWVCKRYQRPATPETESEGS